MGIIELPGIGDIITFSETWLETTFYIPDDIPTGQPHGLIISIQDSADFDVENDNYFFATLAYPLMEPNFERYSQVYMVMWASAESHIRETYRCINEEWFYQGLFKIISKAKRSEGA